MGGLERSIGAKLADRLGSNVRVLAIEDVTAVLDAVGRVGDGDDGKPPVTTDRPDRRRRLYRIREGQQIAGVCAGLAAYSQIRIDWVRTIFILGSVATAGVLGIVYVVMAFVLPVAATHDEWVAAQDSAQA